MRGIIMEALREEMRRDTSVFFVTADMGINLVEPIRDEFPDRYLNVGIAEQNAIGVAAGLASSGFKPWVYTISNFLVHRCFEQVRNDAALHELPITLFGTSSGYDNAPLGPTHHIIDDWGLIAGLPGATVYAPSTDEFASTVVNRIQESQGLTYLRVAKGSVTYPDSEADVVTVGDIVDSSRPLVISYGGVGGRLLTSADSLDGVNLLVLNKLAPLPALVTEALNREPESVVVVEDHFSRNGLAGDVALHIAQHGLGTRLVPIAPASFDLVVGESTQELDKRNGLDASSVASCLAKLLD
jgi:transketolase